MAFDDTDRIGFGRKVYDYFASKGLAPHQAAAIAGNMAWEGGGRADLVNPNDNLKNSPASPHSFGVGQWNDRLPRLVNFARSKGINIPQGDLRDVTYVRSIAPMIPLNTQLDFAWDDMNGPEGRAFNAIRNSPDLRTATGGAISYHRPAGWTWNNPEAGHAFPQRMALGGQILSSSQTPIDAAGNTRSAYDNLADSFGPGTPTAITTGSTKMPTPLPQSGVAVNAPQGMSPEQVAYNRRLAMELAGQGSSTAPVQHWTQALARAVQGGVGGLWADQARQGEQQGRAAANAALQQALAGGTPNVGALVAAASMPQAGPIAGAAAGHALTTSMDENSQKGKLGLELLKAQVEQAKRKDSMDELMTGLMSGSGAAPTASAASPAPATTGAISTPGIAVSPPTSSAAATPAPASQESFRQLFMRQPQGQQMSYYAAYKKGDAKQMDEILERWQNPNKKQDEARQKEFGEAQGKAQAALPGAMVSTDRMLKKMDDVLNEPDPKNPGKYLPDPNNPGQSLPNKTLPGITGPLQGKLPTIFGKKRDMEEELKQIQGGVFMEAYQALKGGGAISDAEGKPATQAIARLAALDQSDNGYRKALIEARNEVLKLRQLAQDRAAGKIPMPSASSDAPPGQPAAPQAAAAPSQAFIQEAASAGIPPEVAAQVPEGKRIKNPKTGQSFLKINGRLVDENAGNAAAAADAQSRYAPTLPNPLSNFDPSGQFTGGR